MGLPSCTIYLPLHAIPPTPEDPMSRFRYLVSSAAAFPSWPKGRHLQLSDEATSRFACATACSFALGNSQPLITQTLLPGANKANEQHLMRDFNPLDKSPITAYGQAFHFTFEQFNRSTHYHITYPKIFAYCLKRILNFVSGIFHSHGMSNFSSKSKFCLATQIVTSTGVKE